MTTTATLSRFVAALAGVVALCGLLAATAAAAPTPQTAPGDPLDPRTYAPDSRLFLVLHAIGVQRYACQADGTWLFTDPVALLIQKDGAPKAAGIHFLNFATGRPVWQLWDGSSVEAARRVGVPAGAGNIPSLLLQSVATAPGAGGEGLGGTTWVQRLNTRSGVAPTRACTPGATRAVLYGADYFFWSRSGD